MKGKNETLNLQGKKKFLGKRKKKSETSYCSNPTIHPPLCLFFEPLPPLEIPSSLLFLRCEFIDEQFVLGRRWTSWWYVGAFLMIIVALSAWKRYYWDIWITNFPLNWSFLNRVPKCYFVQRFIFRMVVVFEIVVDPLRNKAWTLFPAHLLSLAHRSHVITLWY